jgi:hypothetical protein
VGGFLRLFAKLDGYRGLLARPDGLPIRGLANT